MADPKVPYLAAYGRLKNALERIKAAQTPPRFTQDFLETKLSMKGGSARPIIPFLKRTGFLGSDGTPTSIYQRFRNPAQSGAAAAEALRHGYGPLYEINEYVHDVKDPELKGIIVQATGLDEGASTVRAIMGSFKTLREFADFETVPADEPAEHGPESEGQALDVPRRRTAAGELTLGYTINLQLPATSDIAVFNAIFKSLRDHLL
ncbi:MAG: hypothetical protein QOH76_2736 [Thermoleophilaceae bacterium]|jgi:hypothetical protein|nr:hypothetical protein [Thermoleophilaceae bacterium]